jgi:hypothetical protein
MLPAKTLYFGLLLFFFGCASREQRIALVSISESRPVIDGQVDACWKDLPEYPIDGSLVGEINWDGNQDISASFRVLLHDNDLFFLVKVFDDIEGQIESSLLDQYWENDNVEFFFTNSKKMGQEEFSDGDSIFFVNYSSPFNRLEKLVNKPESKTQYITFGRTEIAGGYMLEAGFQQELGLFDFSNGSIPFNLELSDNDNDNKEEGFVKGRESGIAWAPNSARSSWQETINYGELVVELK